MTDAIGQLYYVLRPDGTALYANQTVLDYTVSLWRTCREKTTRTGLPRRGFGKAARGAPEAFARGKPFELEQRALEKTVTIAGFVRYNPFATTTGTLFAWYATGTDIEDRKRAEESMRDENLALRGANRITRSCLRKLWARTGPANRALPVL